MRSKLSVTVYLFLALYGSTTLQSRSSLKIIKNFLCKQKLVNNRSIPSMHAERKITVCSHKHSFTPYPSLSPYERTESQTEKQINLVGLGNLRFLQVNPVGDDCMDLQPYSHDRFSKISRTFFESRN